jgi:hypothetical protein
VNPPAASEVPAEAVTCAESDSRSAQASADVRDAVWRNAGEFPQPLSRLHSGADPCLPPSISVTVRMTVYDPPNDVGVARGCTGSSGCGVAPTHQSDAIPLAKSGSPDLAPLKRSGIRGGLLVVSVKIVTGGSSCGMCELAVAVEILVAELSMSEIVSVIYYLVGTEAPANRLVVLLTSAVTLKCDIKYVVVDVPPIRRGEALPEAAADPMTVPVHEMAGALCLWTKPCQKRTRFLSLTNRMTG